MIESSYVVIHSHVSEFPKPMTLRTGDGVLVEGDMMVPKAGLTGIFALPRTKNLALYQRNSLTATWTAPQRCWRTSLTESWMLSRDKYCKVIVN